MKKILLTTVAALALSAGMALASPFTDQIVAGLQRQGFERIGIQEGLTQVKVEAIRGTTKFEVVYDLATGAILKQETSTVDGSDDVAPGIRYDTENRDFVDASDDSNDDLDDDGNDDLDDDGNDDIDDDSNDDNSGDDSSDDNSDDSESDDSDDDSNDDNDDNDSGDDDSDNDGEGSQDD